MIDSDALFIPDKQLCSKTVLLAKRIMAIELTADDTGGVKLGPLTALGSGAALEICGTGFNDRTIKVRTEGQCYFVFLKDIEPN
jgi:hypothetical protein